MISYLDLLQLARSLQRMQNNLINGGQLLGMSAWAYVMAGVSMGLCHGVSMVLQVCAICTKLVRWCRSRQSS